MRISDWSSDVCSSDLLAALPPWLADDAWLYLESPADRAVDPGTGWRLHRESRSRDARHAQYRRSGGGTPTPARPPDDRATSPPCAWPATDTRSTPTPSTQPPSTTSQLSPPQPPCSLPCP